MNFFLDMEAIIGRMRLVTGLNNTDIATQLLDISKSNLSNRIKSNQIPFKKIITWAVNENINIGWLLTGFTAIDVSDLDSDDDLLLRMAAEVLRADHPQITPTLRESIRAFYLAVTANKQK